MSTQDTQTPVPGAESNADGVSTDSGTDTQESTSSPLKGNREARYRTERNAAREELAAAHARITTMQRAEVERLATEAGLSHGSDVFTLSGNGPADYLDDDGNVDPARVAADVAAVLVERPGLKKQAPAFDPSQGSGGTKPKQSTASWGALFQ